MHRPPPHQPGSVVQGQIIYCACIMVQIQSKTLKSVAPLGLVSPQRCGLAYPHEIPNASTLWQHQNPIHTLAALVRGAAKCQAGLWLSGLAGCLAGWLALPRRATCSACWPHPLLSPGCTSQPEICLLCVNILQGSVIEIPLPVPAEDDSYITVICLYNK